MEQSCAGGPIRARRHHYRQMAGAAAEGRLAFLPPLRGRGERVWGYGLARRQGERGIVPRVPVRAGCIFHSASPPLNL